MEQNTLYVDGKPVGIVVGIDLGAGDDFTSLERRIVGLNADHFILDELPLFRNSTTVYLRGLELNDRMPGWLWTSHRTRNLSHRPVAGARKRKEALKYAARQHRVAVRVS
jgi:hypothetical protein